MTLLSTRGLSKNFAGLQAVQNVDFDLPAGETVSLEPGGLHIMLIRLTRPIQEGESIEITLRFAGGAAQTLEFAARAPGTEHQGGGGVSKP